MLLILCSISQDSIITNHPLTLLFLLVSGWLMAILLLQMFFHTMVIKNVHMQCQKCHIFILEKRGTLVSQIEFHRIPGHSPLKAIKLVLQQGNWNKWDPHLNHKR